MLQSRVKAGDLCKRLGGISNATLWRMIKRGVIPQPTIINNIRYWTESEIEEAFHAAMKGPGQFPGQATG
ncbi:MAG: helix-turn-helix domain-containing protein [Magnetococcales bacterium]|nr:helix-turn-helix domain-containing protein [Magnetococcales bacterium]